MGKNDEYTILKKEKKQLINKQKIHLTSVVFKLMQ